LQLEQRVNPLDDLNQLIKEPKSFWIGILEEYFVKNHFVSIECYPSKEEQQKMAKDEKERIEKQRQELGSLISWFRSSRGFTLCSNCNNSVRTPD